MTKKHFPKGLDGRMQDANGEIHKKRSNTKVETLRKEYGEKFSAGYRSDAKNLCCNFFRVSFCSKAA